MTLEQDIQNNPTVFGKILRGEIPCKKVYEDETILAFYDIAPKAKVHVVVIPKQLIESFADATDAHKSLLGDLMCKLPIIAEKAGVLQSGFRIVSNSREDSGQEVPHMHIHLLGGERLSSNFGA